MLFSSAIQTQTMHNTNIHMHVFKTWHYFATKHCVTPVLSFNYLLLYHIWLGHYKKNTKKEEGTLAWHRKFLELNAELFDWATFVCNLVFIFIGPIQQLHKIISNIADLDWIVKCQKYCFDYRCLKLGVWHICRVVYMWVFMVLI